MKPQGKRSFSHFRNWKFAQLGRIRENKSTVRGKFQTASDRQQVQSTIDLLQTERFG
jgi:hypothetical protein